MRAEIERRPGRMNNREVGRLVAEGFAKEREVTHLLIDQQRARAPRVVTLRVRPRAPGGGLNEAPGSADPRGISAETRSPAGPARA